MLLPRICAPARVALRASKSSHGTLSSSVVEGLLPAAAATSPFLTFVRNATHASEGRANGSKDGAGKRLGAKKTAEEYVIPGNIIFRQRGTKWYPGENVGMGRDHTIFSLAHGYVKYYKDPINHPKRQFIGVTFDRADKLPYPANAARKRRLGMEAVQMNPAVGATGQTAGLLTPAQGVEVEQKRLNFAEKVRRRDYIKRETNWEIGRAAEKAGVKVREFVPGDRFRAWRKRGVKKAKAQEKRTLASAGKGKGKKPAAKRRW